MSVARLVALIAVAGCGRIGFDDGSARATPDGGSDGSSALGFGPCHAGSAAGPTATLSGTTIQFTSYSTFESFPAIPIAVVDASGATLASTSSDSIGNFSIPIKIADNATTVGLATPPGGYESTTLYPGVPITSNVGNLQLPVWSVGAIMSIYGTGNAPYDDTLAMLSIDVVTCDGAPIGGATVSVSPPPAQIDYLGSDSKPQQQLTSTDPTSGFALGFEIPPGPVTITAAAAGYTFEPQTIVAGSGEHIDIVQMHGRD